MHPLDAATTQPLQWHQHGRLRRSYTLRNADGQVEADLQWKSILGGEALGHTHAGAWLFKQVGFFNPYVAIHRVQHHGATTPVLQLQLAFNGSAHFTDQRGRNFVWKANGLWADSWNWLMDYELVVRIRPQQGSSTPAELHIAKNDLSEAEVSLLVLSGWYLMERSGGLGLV